MGWSVGFDATWGRDHPVHQGYVKLGDLAGAAPYGGLLSANRSTLAKMRELEAGK